MRRPGQVLSRYQLSSTHGTTRTRTAPTWSTCTCATCARRSTGRSAPRAFRPYVAPGTGSKHDAQRAVDPREADGRVRRRASARVALAGLFVYLRVSSQLTEALDDGLEARVNDVESLLSRSEGRAKTHGGPVRGRGGGSCRSSPRTARWWPRRSSSEPALIDPAQVDRATDGPLVVERDVPGLDAQARILARDGDLRGGDAIVAGASTGDRDEALAGIAGAFAIGAPLALLVASGLGYLLASRSLAPVDHMRRKADEITLERSGEWLPLPRRGRDPPARRTLNRMLDRIEASLERQRVFVADASHELRTPLAVLRASSSSRTDPSERGRSSGGSPVGGRGGRSALTAGRRPARGRTVRSGRVADQARAGGPRRAA